MPTAPQVSTIQITNATTLGFSRTLETFGSDITFKIVDEVRLSLAVYDMTNDGAILSEISDLFTIQNSEDWAMLYVNNVLYGRAKLTSFSLPEGNFSKTARCEVTFLIHSRSDDVANLAGSYYADYGDALAEAYASSQVLDSITESVDLDIGENSISYSKQISVKFSDSAQITASGRGLIKVAQNFAKKIFAYDESNAYAHIPVYAIESGISALLVAGYRKLRSETINSTTNECSFSESIQASNVITTTGNVFDYSHEATQQIQIDRFGIATLTESGAIKGLIEPVLTSAVSAYAVEREYAKKRLTDLFDEIAECATDNGLNKDASNEVRFVSESKTIREEEGIIEYELTANNDPYYNTGASNVIYERTITISKSSGYTTVEESGTITGMSKIKIDSVQQDTALRYPKYAQAKDYFTSTVAATESTIRSRLALVSGNDSLSPKPISRSETHSLFQGTMSYTQTFSDAPEFAENSSYKTFSVSEGTQKATNKFNEFGIVNDRVFVQDLAGKTQGVHSISVNVVGYRTNPETNNIATNMGVLLAYAKTKVTETPFYLNPSSDINHLNSASYSFSHYNEVRLNLAVSYITELEEAEALS